MPGAGSGQFSEARYRVRTFGAETSTKLLAAGVSPCGARLTGSAPGERMRDRISSAVPARVSASDRRSSRVSERPPIATRATMEAASATNAPRRGARPASGTSSMARCSLGRSVSGGATGAAASARSPDRACRSARVAPHRRRARTGPAARSRRAARRSARGPGSTFVLPSERHAQLAHGGERPGLNGPDRDAEFLGDHHLCLAPEVRHLQHLSLLGGKGRESFADLLASDADVGVLDDVLRRVFAVHRLEVRGALGTLAQPLLAPDGVHGSVVYERQEEGSEGASGAVERLGRAPQREEGLLDDLLRDQLLGRHPERDAVGRAAVSAVELVESGAIARRDTTVEC